MLHIIKENPDKWQYIHIAEHNIVGYPTMTLESFFEQDEITYARISDFDIHSPKLYIEISSYITTRTQVTIAHDNLCLSIVDITFATTTLGSSILQFMSNPNIQSIRITAAFIGSDFVAHALQIPTIRHLYLPDFTCFNSTIDALSYNTTLLSFLIRTSSNRIVDILERNRDYYPENVNHIALEFAIALSPLNLPPYIMLEIFDWTTPSYTSQKSQT